MNDTELDDKRASAAEAEYQSYIEAYEDRDVHSSDGWIALRCNKWRCNYYVARENNAELSKKVAFTVKFAHGSDQVLDSCTQERR